ncbi:MAG: riboflavin synthase, partial [Actinomycetes bacterium]
MFTGIIAEQGHVLSVERDGDSATVRLHAPGTTEGLALGGSIAVNGVCLTATEIAGKEFSVDVMGETLVRSTIGELAPGDSVNLERCVQAGGRLDGHVVQGHVDGVGELLEREPLGNWDRLFRRTDQFVRSIVVGKRAGDVSRHGRERGASADQR